MKPNTNKVQFIYIYYYLFIFLLFFKTKISKSPFNATTTTCSFPKKKGTIMPLDLNPHKIWRNFRSCIGLIYRPCNLWRELFKMLFCLMCCQKYIKMCFFLEEHHIFQTIEGHSYHFRHYKSHWQNPSLNPH